MSETAELAEKLAHRDKINKGKAEPKIKLTRNHSNVYAEFEEFSRKQIKEYERIFKEYDTSMNGYLEQSELQAMMEKLGAPQTYLALKKMMKEADEDNDGRISFREFLLIFRKSALGELEEESGLHELAKLTAIDVKEIGVGGAKDFFDAKASAVRRGSKFEEELKQEAEERKMEAEVARIRKLKFMEKRGSFSSMEPIDLPMIRKQGSLG